MNPDTVAVALEAGKAIAVRPQGMSPTSWGVWVGVLIAMIYTFPKFWLQIKKMGYDRGDAIDDERKSDMDKMRAEIAEIKVEAKEAREHATAAEEKWRAAESRLSAAVIVIRVLSAKIRSEWPNDPLLQNIGELIDVATSPDQGVLKGLSKIPGLAGKQD